MHYFNLFALELLLAFFPHGVLQVFFTCILWLHFSAEILVVFFRFFWGIFQAADFLDRRSSLAYQFIVVVVAVDVAVSFGSRYFNKLPLILRFRRFDLRCPPSVPCQKCFLQ